MITLKKQQGLICENLSRSPDGELCLAGQSVKELSKKYGTPLYLYDEERIRERCRTYKRAVMKAFGEGASVLYASKAASFRRLYEIMREEKMGIDVVSCGEIYTATLADFPLSKAYFHSNNKTDEDIAYAIDRGIGYFVVDNEEELFSINEIAGERGVRQKILLRITPGIDPHTYAAVATGKVDSKFGSAIETGQAEQIIKRALSLENLDLKGFHCHIGSQIFDCEVYIRAAEVMLGLVKKIYDTEGFLAEELNLGGGFGVRYIESQPTLDIEAEILKIGAFVKKQAKKLKISLPKILFEPGRSIVADSGLTVYTVGTIKNIPGYKTYVSVDGGMADNPRFALYGSPYTILTVDDASGKDCQLCSVVGRCCESGDILQENVLVPTDIKRGDLIACLTSGAYHYSMASNYNRLPRPPIVMVNGNDSYVAVRRETVEHVSALDV